MTLVAIEIAPRNISLVISDLDYQFSYYLQGSKKLPPILFFHGFMGNKDVFADTISLLSDQFYCLAIDLPGHGNTIIKGGDECYQMDNTALALVEWLDKLTIDQCFLVGYSMGGRLALYLACFFPERFPKVVLESSSPGLKTRREREERREGDH